jgi:hypothetical protein
MLSLTFCPATGCGAPAEIVNRHVLPSSHGPIEHVTTYCVRRHRFVLPSGRLAWSTAGETGDPDWAVTPQRAPVAWPFANRRPLDDSSLAESASDGSRIRPDDPAAISEASDSNGSHLPGDPDRRDIRGGPDRPG